GPVVYAIGPPVASAPPRTRPHGESAHAGECGDPTGGVPGSSPMAGADRTPKPRAAGSMFDRLAARRLVVVSGKGGVGRTTIAALLGIALSDRGRKVLVATTGHDDRL